MWWHKRKRQLEQEHAEAQEALRESVDHLHDTVQRGAEVRQTVRQLQKIQRDNHFAEAIQHVYRGASP